MMMHWQLHLMGAQTYFKLSTCVKSLCETKYFKFKKDLQFHRTDGFQEDVHKVLNF